MTLWISQTAKAIRKGFAQGKNLAVAQSPVAIKKCPGPLKVEV